MKVLILVVLFPLIFSFSLENIVSTTLDFVPGVNKIKNLYESVSGKDMVTGEDLSNSERFMSFLSIVPFVGPFFKNSKYLKNAEKFKKAAERAKKAGKMKNAKSFAKAAERAFKKAVNFFWR